MTLPPKIDLNAVPALARVAGRTVTWPDGTQVVLAAYDSPTDRAVLIHAYTRAREARESINAVTHGATSEA